MGMNDETRGPGRPRLPDSLKRTERVRVKMNADERAALEAECARRGMVDRSGRPRIGELLRALAFEAIARPMPAERDGGG